MAKQNTSVTAASGSEAAPQVSPPAGSPIPWYLKGLDEANKIASDTDREAEQAEDDAYAQEQNLTTDHTAGAKKNADLAREKAAEESANARIAEEEALERSMWAVRMGERDEADRILQKHPSLIDTDSQFYK